MEFRVVADFESETYQFWLPDYYDAARRELWPRDEDGPTLRKKIEDIAWAACCDRWIGIIVGRLGSVVGTEFVHEIYVPVKGSREEE